jgi:Ni/Fe-hydrogenase subunit HybB-like protein
LIVPTVTHPRLVPYSTYTPTLTEISLTAASVALFMLLFVLFFKLFPPVSIWEIAEGRVVEAAHEQINIPIPEPSTPRHRRQRWGLR